MSVHIYRTILRPIHDDSKLRTIRYPLHAPQFPLSYWSVFVFSSMLAFKIIGSLSMSSIFCNRKVLKAVTILLEGIKTSTSI
jgi:hypothetical protein